MAVVIPSELVGVTSLHRPKDFNTDVNQCLIDFVSDDMSPDQVLRQIESERHFNDYMGKESP